MQQPLGDIPDFSLEDGDTFYIPPRLNTVQVAGSVYNANAFRHQPEKRLVAYLNDAGGATREADQSASLSSTPTEPSSAANLATATATLKS
jgi:protein involved in polysaccharide export with SLBB domain